MNIIGSLFKSQIDKAAAVQAKRMASDFSTGLQSMVAFMNKGLQTINEDGYDYYQTFKTIGAVYEVTDLIAKKVINSPYVFYKVKDKKKLQQSKSLIKTDPIQSYLLKLQAVEEVDEPGLLALLNNPNPYQNGVNWLWTTALIYLIHGNAFVHGDSAIKKKRELFTFPNMKVLANDKDLLDPITGYRMEFINNEVEKDFLKEDIYHMKTGNPANISNHFQYLYGVSPLRAYLEPMRTIKEANTQASKQAKNGGTFGILSPRDKEDQLDSDQKKQLKEKMSEARRSDDEMARVFPSSISLLWQNIGLPIADLKLLELVDAKEVSVYRAYHMPLSYHNQKASTDNNVGTEVKKMVYDAVSPITDAIGEMLTAFVGKGYGDIIIELDYTQLPEMAINMKEVADYIIPMYEAGLITPDEARSALKWGETNFDYMKEHYVKSGITTLRRTFEGEKTE